MPIKRPDIKERVAELVRQKNSRHRKPPRTIQVPTSVPSRKAPGLAAQNQIVVPTAAPATVYRQSGDRTKDDDARLNAPSVDPRPFTSQFGGKRPTLMTMNDVYLKMNAASAKATNFMASFTNPDSISESEVDDRLADYRNRLEGTVTSTAPSSSLGNQLPSGGVLSQFPSAPLQNKSPYQSTKKLTLLPQVKWLGLQYPDMPEEFGGVNTVALFTPDGQSIPVSTDSDLWVKRAKLELALDNDVSLNRISKFEKDLKMMAYDVTSMGYIDDLGKAQRIAEVINDVDSTYNILGALYRVGQFTLEGGWIGLQAKVTASDADVPKPGIGASTQEKIDWLKKYDVPLQEAKLKEAQSDLNNSEGVLPLLFNLARVIYYSKKVDDPLDYERAIRGAKTSLEYFKESQVGTPESYAAKAQYVGKDPQEERALEAERIRTTQKAEAEERIGQITDEISIIQAELEELYSKEVPDSTQEQVTEEAARKWEVAVELMIEKQFLRDSISDTYAYSGAYTWHAEPERYELFQKNRALFELQTGRPPTIQEERRIKQLSVNMAAEFWGEVIFDATNVLELVTGSVIPTAFPTLASKVKFASKLTGEAVGNVLTKADNVLKTTKGVNAIYEIGKTVTYPIRYLFTQNAASLANRTKNNVFNIFSVAAKSFTDTSAFAKTIGQVGDAAQKAIGKGLRETLQIYEDMIRKVPGTRSITFDAFASLVTVADVSKHGIEPSKWAEMYLRAVDDFTPVMEETIKNRLMRAAKLNITDKIPDELAFTITDTINKAKTPGGMEVAIGKFSEQFERNYLDAFRVTNKDIWGRGSDILSDTLWGRMVLGLRATAGDLDTKAVQDILSYTGYQSMDLGKSINKALLEFSIGLGKKMDGSRSAASFAAAQLADAIEVVNRVMGVVRTGWIVMVLTLNPRYYLGNFIDNTFRTIPYGGNPLDDVWNLGNTFKSWRAALFGGPEPATEAAIKLKQLGGTVPAQIGQSLARPDLDATSTVANRILYEGWNPKFGLGSFISDEWTRLKNEQTGFQAIPESIARLLGDSPLARATSQVLESTSLAWKSLINGATDFNASIEFTFRLRTFHREYFKELAVAENIFKREAMEGLNKNLLKTAEALFDGALSPDELLAKVKDMVDPSSNTFKNWSTLLPSDAFDALKGMTPGERSSFLATFRDNADEYFNLLQMAGRKVDGEAIDAFMDAVEKSFLDLHDVYMQAAQRERLLVDTINAAVPDRVQVPDDILDSVTGAAVPPPATPSRTNVAEKVKPIKYNRVIDNLESTNFTVEKIDGDGFEIVREGDVTTFRLGSNSSNETIRKGLLSAYASENEELIRAMTGMNSDRFVEVFDDFIKNPIKFSDATPNKGQVQNLLLIFESAEMEKYRYAMKGSGIRLQSAEVEVLMKRMDLKAFDRIHPEYSKYGYVPSYARRISGNAAAIAQVNLKNAAKRLDGKTGALLQKFDSGVDELLRSSLSDFYREVYPGPKVAEYGRASKWKMYDKMMTTFYDADVTLRTKVYDLSMGAVAGRPGAREDLDAFLENFNQDYITNWLTAHGIEDVRFEDGRLVSFSITSYDLGTGEPLIKKFNSTDSSYPASLQRLVYSDFNRASTETTLSFLPSKLKNENLDSIASNLIISFGLTRSSADEFAKVVHNYAEMIADMTGNGLTFRDVLARLGFKRLDYSVDIEDIYKMQNIPDVDMFTLVGNGTRNVESLTAQLGNLFYRDMVRLVEQGDDAARKIGAKNVMDIHNMVSKITGTPVSGRLSDSELQIFREIFTNYIYAGETGNREFAPVFKNMRRFLSNQFKDVDVNKAIPKVGIGDAGGAPTNLDPNLFASDMVDDETYSVLDRMFMGHKTDSFDSDGARVRLLRTIAKNNGIEFKSDRQLLNFINKHSSVVGVDEVTRNTFINSMVNAGRSLEEAEVAFDIMKVRAGVWSQRLNQPIDKIFDTLFVVKLDAPPRGSLLQTPPANPKEIVTSELVDFIQLANKDSYSNGMLDKFWGEFSRDTFRKNVWTDPAFAKVVSASWLDDPSMDLPKAIDELFTALEKDNLTEEFLQKFNAVYLNPKVDDVRTSIGRMTNGEVLEFGKAGNTLEGVASVISSLRDEQNKITDALANTRTRLNFDDVFDASSDETLSAWFGEAVQTNDELLQLSVLADEALGKTFGERRENIKSITLDILNLQRKTVRTEGEDFALLLRKKALIDEVNLVEGKVTNPYLYGTPEYSDWEYKHRITTNMMNAIVKSSTDIDPSTLTPMDVTVVANRVLQYMDSLGTVQGAVFREQMRLSVVREDINSIVEFVHGGLNLLGRGFSVPDLGDQMIRNILPARMGTDSILPTETMKKLISDLMELEKFRLGGGINSLPSPSGAEILKQQLGSVTKGAYWTRHQDRFIALGEEADVSTFFHEFWHDYLQELRSFASSPDASFDWARGDLDVLTKAAGLKDGAEFNALRQDFENHALWTEALSRVEADPKALPLTSDEIKANIASFAERAKRYEDAEELIVRTGLAYFKSGKAPVSELEKAFERLKEWFSQIWEQIKSSTFRITPKVRSAFDRAFVGAPSLKVPSTRYTSLGDVPLYKIRELAKMTTEEQSLKELNAAFDMWKMQKGPLQGIDPDYLKDYDTLTRFLAERISTSEGPMVDEYRRILFQLEHLTDEIGARYNKGYKKMGIPVPKEDMVGSEMKTLLKKGQDNVRILESIRAFVPRLRQHMHKVLESGEFLPGLTKAEIDELVSWAEKASSIKGQMNDILTNGGTFLGKEGQHLYTSTGALKKTNDIMIDYSTRTHFDSIMRSVFPFWMFPSRSLPFWLKTVGTHPAILAMYMKLQRASETSLYQQGAVDRNGKTYKSMKGYLPLGTTGLWINPVQQLSGKYLLDAMYYGDYLMEQRSYGSTYEETSPGAAVLTDMIESGPLLGLFPAPWMKTVLGTFMNVPADTFPTFPIGPQVSLIPRWKYEIFFNQGQIRKSAFDNIIYPEVSWKESQIEKALLEQYMMDVDSGKVTDSQLERDKVWKAIRDKGSNPLWIQAKRDYENNEAETSRLSFFTGAYLKSYTDGKADFVKQKNDIELMSWALNSPAMAATLGLPTDPSARDELINSERFDTPDAWLHNLYNMTNWVRNSDGQYVDDPKERARLLAEDMDEQARINAIYSQLRQAKITREDALAQLPIGSYNTPEWNAAWAAYNAEANALYNSLPPKDYYGTVATNEKIEEKVRAEWWRRLVATMPTWDVKNEEYEDYEKKVNQWKMSLPALARTLAGTVSEDYPDGQGTFQYYLSDIRTHLRKGQTISDAFVEQLISESTSAGYDQFRRSNDDLLTALNEVYRIEYEKPYYSTLANLGGFTRRYAEDEWTRNNPEPDATKLFRWLEEHYPGRFTLEEVKAQLGSIEDHDKVFSMQERSDAKKSDYELQKQEIWEVLASAGLSKQKAFVFTNEFIDARTGLPNSQDYLTTWYLSNGQAWDKQDPEAQKAFEAFHDAVMKLAKEQKIGPLSSSQVAVLAKAESMNRQFNLMIQRELGVEFLSDYDKRRVGLLGAYLSMDRADRKEFKYNNPELYALIPEYYRLRDEFARNNPLWAQFYYKYNPEAEVKQNGPVIFGTGGGYRPRKKYKPGQGSGSQSSVPTQAIPWPTGFTNFISLEMMQEIVAFLNTNQGLSNATVTYLETLAVNHPEWAPFIQGLIE